MDVVNLLFPNRNQLYFEIALVDEPAIESEVMMFKEVDFQFKEVEGEEQKMELITDVPASAPLTMVKEVVIEEVNVEFVKNPRRKYNKKPKTEVTDKKEAKPKKNKKDDK